MFQQDKGIGIAAGVLPLGHDALEYLVDVGHVEVATQQQVARTPVAPAQKRVYIRQARTAGGAVAQVPHVDLAGKRQVQGRPLGIGRIVGRILNLGLYIGKNLLYGTGPQSAFPVDKLLGRTCVQLHASQPGPLLPPVVLFLHEQVELVQPIHVRAVLLLIISEWFQQPHHGDATLVFDNFCHKIESL